jgi:hypothetical protein
MLPCVKNIASRSWHQLGAVICIATALTFTAWGDGAVAKTSPRGSAKQMTFSSPTEASKALIAAAKADDVQQLMAILGPEGKDLVHSGDAVADRGGRQRFVEMYEQKNRLVREGEGRVVLKVGKKTWPFPIPIVMKRGVWLFDTHAARQEMLNRGIGRNELSTIQICLAYVDAQREYADIIREIDGRRKYAQKFVSDADQKNGLYWKVKEGERQSPLGPFVAEAQKEGYGKKAGHNPNPYHGYFFRVLKAQGRTAPGGAYDYVVDGNMIGGFALIAYPATYGVSGVMTFIVNHDGIIYEKNLGKNTEAMAQKMKSYDPDNTWRKVPEEYLVPPSKDN